MVPYMFLELSWTKVLAVLVSGSANASPSCHFLEKPRSHIKVSTEGVLLKLIDSRRDPERKYQQVDCWAIPLGSTQPASLVLSWWLTISFLPSLSGSCQCQLSAPWHSLGRKSQPAISGWRHSQEKPEQRLPDEAEGSTFQAHFSSLSKGSLAKMIIFPGPFSDQLKNSLSCLPTLSHTSASRFLLRQNPP